MHIGELRRRSRRRAAIGLVAVILFSLTGAGRAAPKSEGQFEFKSPSAILMDAATGGVILEQNGDEPKAPASVTKIMTLIMIYDAVRNGRARWEDEVVVSPAAAGMGGTQVFLQAGESLSLREMTRAIAIGSANDASVAVAEYLSGSHEAFVQAMNRRAAELGMTGSKFVNATGLDAPGHVMTARDVAIASRYLISSYPEVLELTRIHVDHVVRPGGQKQEMHNANQAILPPKYDGYPGADGLKTGYTARARYSVSVTAERQGTRLIAVVMGADSSKDRFDDIYRMLNWGFGRIVSPLVAEADKPLGRVPVLRGRTMAVDAVVEREFRVGVERGREKGLTYAVELQPRLVAPIKRGEPVGEIVVRLDGEEIARQTLVAATDVPAVGILGLTWRILGQLLRFR